MIGRIIVIAVFIGIIFLCYYIVFSNAPQGEEIPYVGFVEITDEEE